MAHLEEEITTVFTLTFNEDEWDLLTTALRGGISRRRLDTNESFVKTREGMQHLLSVLQGV